MKTAIKVKEEGWNRATSTLFHSLHFLDWLVISGFLFWMGAMVLTVYLTSISVLEGGQHFAFFEANPIAESLLSGNKFYSVILFGTFWSVVLTAYYTFRGKIMSTFLAFHIFSIYLFDLAHDITWLMVVVLK